MNETVWQRMRAALEKWNAVLQKKEDASTRMEKMAARAALLRQERSAPVAAEEARLFLAFFHGPHRFAVPVDEVIEIQALDGYSPVPGTPAYIRGVVNWRGAVLALIDLTRLFGIPESGLADIHACVVVESGGRRVALLAGEVEEILGIAPSAIKPMPDWPQHASAEWVMGVHEQQRMLLRVDKVLDHLGHSSHEAGSA